MMKPTRPIVIAHRGASGYRPEHTLASYWLAIQQGADFIEPDLVSTREGVLVARHENEISQTTDVSERPEFARRRTTKQIDGQPVTGFFTEDFSLAELQRLRAKERLPDLRPANCWYDRAFRIPTLDQVIALAKLGSRVLRRSIGIYPETKHPSYFASLGLALEEPLVRALHRAGYKGRSAPVFIQSFEIANLQALRHLTQLPLIQLLDADAPPFDLTLVRDKRRARELISNEGLRDIARYADGIGVNKTLIVPQDPSGRSLPPTNLIERAHAANLRVHAWTFRRENAFLPLEHRKKPIDRPAAIGDLIGELRDYLALGLDGMFSDQPDLAFAARRLASRIPR
ncbi:MAG TPA: glycerophosphodiester phosphodiesterase [Polyangiales bacterium]|nr:glycerophosphodiester phosphodiesterase [Polyangiales bacterium]